MEGIKEEAEEIIEKRELGAMIAIPAVEGGVGTSMMMKVGRGATPLAVVTAAETETGAPQPRE